MQIRPKTRADCHTVRDRLTAHLDDADPYRVHRPCPFVSCRYHLHVDVEEATGVVTVMSTETTPLDIAHTCVLDVIDEHPEGVSREELAIIDRTSEERGRFRERRIERKARELGLLEAWEGHESAKGEGLLAGVMEA